MIYGRGIRAWLTHEPWNDAYDVRLVHDAGGYVSAAVRIEDGHFVYEKVEPETVVAPVLRLWQAEVDALLSSLSDHGSPQDATVDALRDAREVRDRLLVIVEHKSGVTKPRK